jgi:hypothetical protein
LWREIPSCLREGRSINRRQHPQHRGYIAIRLGVAQRQDILVAIAVPQVASTASGQKICARHSIILLEPGETAAVNDAGSSGTELLISGPAPTRPSGAEQNAVRQQAAIWAGYRDKGW